MRLVIPCLNELVSHGAPRIGGCKIRQASALALEDTDPRFHVIQPGAMHGRAGHDQACLMRQPLSDLLPLRRTDMVAHQMNRADMPLNLDSHGVETGPAFPLPLAVITVPGDLARTGVEGGQEMEGPRPLVLRLAAGGQVVELGW